MDRNGDGVLTLKDIKGWYSAKNHPDVVSGRRSEDQVLGEFLETFEIHHNMKRGSKDQTVTLEEFFEYYKNVSANIDNDQYFELMINNSFKLNVSGRSDQEKKSKTTANAPFGTFSGSTDYNTTSNRSVNRLSQGSRNETPS